MSYEIAHVTLAEQPTVVVRGTVAVADIPAFLGMAYGKVMAAIGAAGAAPAGAPFARFRQTGGEFEVEAGFPVAEALDVAGADVEGSTLPAGDAAQTWHIGPYEAMTAAYEAVDEWVAAKGGEAAGPPWEIYHSDPNVEPDPARWRTQVVQPYRMR